MAFWAILSVTSGCELSMQQTPSPATPIPDVPIATVALITNTPRASATPAPTPTPITPTATVSPYPWTDANAVMGGICFESAYDAAGRTFVIESAEELSAFFDLADNSGLCRQPVARNTFDFRDNLIIVGMWSRGMGCTARHDVESFQRDDSARSLVIFLKLVTEGDCNYELVRPYWIAIDNALGYDVELIVD